MLKQYPMTPEEKAALDDLSEEGLAKMVEHVEGLIARGNVTGEELSKIRMNSERYHRMLPALTTEAFLDMHQYCAANCWADPRGITYNDAIATHYVREVQRRMTLQACRIRGLEEQLAGAEGRAALEKQRADQLEESLEALETAVFKDAAERRAAAEKTEAAAKKAYWK